jgi:hypothetical protein
VSVELEVGVHVCRQCKQCYMTYERNAGYCVTFGVELFEDGEGCGRHSLNKKNWVLVVVLRT